MRYKTRKLLTRNAVFIGLFLGLLFIFIVVLSVLDGG